MQIFHGQTMKIVHGLTILFMVNEILCICIFPATKLMPAVLVQSAYENYTGF